MFCFAQLSIITFSNTFKLVSLSWAQKPLPIYYVRTAFRYYLKQPLEGTKSCSYSDGFKFFINNGFCVLPMCRHDI